MTPALRHRPTSPLARIHALAGGPPVRLRLARRFDEPAVRALLDACGVETSDLEVRRLIHADPTRCTVLCAFAMLDGREALVGIGAIERTADAEVDTLVADDSLADGVGELLMDVLRERAQTHARRLA